MSGPAVLRRVGLCVAIAAVTGALFASSAVAWHPTCQQPTKLNFRFHYKVQKSNGSWTSGSWSSTKTVYCPGNGTFAPITIGPQGWGNQSVTNSTPLIVGYTLTAPGINTPVSVTVAHAKVAFSPVTAGCGFSVLIPDDTFSVTGHAWSGQDFRTTVGAWTSCTSLTLDQATFSADVG